MRTPSIPLALAALFAAAPACADPQTLQQMFGDRVAAAPGAKTPLAQGDFDGDGQADRIFLVTLAPAAGKSIAPDVQVVSGLFGGHAPGAGPGGHGLAIALNGGAKKFLVLDVQATLSDGFFEGDIWTVVAAHLSPLTVKKRGSADLKGFPCLGKAAKGDVALLGTEAGIDIALPWTGTTFKKCVDPTAEP